MKTVKKALKTKFPKKPKNVMMAKAAGCGG
jgi:hypothetical protein